MRNIIQKTALYAVTLACFAVPVQAAEYTVKMISAGDKGNFYYEPRKLTVKSGDTVTWINEQDDTHNVMAEAIPKTAEPFEGPLLDKTGGKWSYTFTKPGTYRYHCHPHAQNGMVGTVIVDRPSRADEIKEINHHSKGGHS
jgi:plastocyanin